MGAQNAGVEEEPAQTGVEASLVWRLLRIPRERLAQVIASETRRTHPISAQMLASSNKVSQKCNHLEDGARASEIDPYHLDRVACRVLCS